MQQMQCANSMEGHCVVAVCVSSCQMVRNAVAPVVHPLHGAGVLGTEMTTGVVAHRPEEDPLAGGASAAVAAGLSPETGGGKGLSPEIGTINLQGPSLDQGVAPGPMKENRELQRDLRWTVVHALLFHGGLQLLSFLCWFFKQLIVLVPPISSPSITFKYFFSGCVQV